MIILTKMNSNFMSFQASLVSSPIVPRRHLVSLPRYYTSGVSFGDSVNERPGHGCVVLLCFPGLLHP